MIFYPIESLNKLAEEYSKFYGEDKAQDIVGALAYSFGHEEAEVIMRKANNREIKIIYDDEVDDMVNHIYMGDEEYFY